MGTGRLRVEVIRRRKFEVRRRRRSDCQHADSKGCVSVTRVSTAPI